MNNHKSIGSYILSIAKKAHMAIDQDKLQAMQNKLMKRSVPFFVVGGVIVIVGFIALAIYKFSADNSIVGIIAYCILMLGAILLSIGGFNYRIGKELYFGGDILENLHSGRVCPKCGEICGENADYCEKCGAKLLKSRVCVRCGKQNEEDSDYCIHCGNKIDDIEFDKNKKYYS